MTREFSKVRHKKLSHFAAALDWSIAASGHNSRSLILAVELSGDKSRIRSLVDWRRGKTQPRHRGSFELLRKVEAYLQLPDSRLRTLIGIERSPLESAIKAANPSHQAMFRWHIPEGFDEKSPEERDAILAWIAANVMPCHTEFGKYQSKASKATYAVVFPDLCRSLGGRGAKGKLTDRADAIGKVGSYGTIAAPPRLATEMADLVSFKTASLPPRPYRRYLRWAPYTANQQVRRYGELFGALAAAPFSASSGLGVAPSKLTLGLLAFPAVWEWFLSWRERRRGFFTTSEATMLQEAKSICRNPTGWVRQNPQLLRRVLPIEGLITARDIERAKRDWPGTNDQVFRYAADRIKELLTVSRAHRDPFDAILPVLTAQSPLAEYKKICDEIIEGMPDEKIAPLEAATTVRSYLMMRFAIHLGVRQRNLRELLFCRQGETPRTARQLQDMKRGELRWDMHESGWEVYIPAVAFKNGGSTFFKGRPFQMLLPDCEDLYAWIHCYLGKHRAVLLKSFSDPDTFFVKNARKSDRTPAYELYSFYDAWKTIIQRYGIYNPYTGRGAIKGLLPHGPHCVRDILATHLLKQTGSYELASFAIQDTVESVMRHYGRFLPHEKIARAAEILNKVWRQNPGHTKV